MKKLTGLFVESFSWRAFLDTRVRLHLLLVLAGSLGLMAFTNPSAPARHPLIQTVSAAGLCQSVSSDTAGVQIVCNNVAGTTIDPGSGTAASGTGITSNTHGGLGSRFEKVTVINTALAAAGTSDVTIWTAPTGFTRVLRMWANPTQNFTGGTLSNVTVTCGTSAGGNQYLLSFTVFSGASGTAVFGDVAAEIGAGLLSATVADFPGASTAVQCRFTCTGDTCNHATQGSVAFYVEYTTYFP